MKTHFLNILFYIYK